MLDIALLRTPRVTEAFLYPIAMSRVSIFKSVLGEVLHVKGDRINVFLLRSSTSKVYQSPENTQMAGVLTVPYYCQIKQWDVNDTLSYPVGHADRHINYIGWGNVKDIIIPPKPEDNKYLTYRGSAYGNSSHAPDIYPFQLL